MTYSYITVLSNWLRGYDRYQRIYSKEFIKESSFPSEFYLLKSNEESIGVSKALKLIEKVNVENNEIIKIETQALDAKKNEKTNKGWVIPRNCIQVARVFVRKENNWQELSLEELTAKAYKLKDHTLKEYKELIPRTLSILPVAKACQARCWFCFSESSISLEKQKFFVDLKKLEEVSKKSKEKGTQRFVITGGGEPGLLNFNNLLEVIKIGSEVFNKVILITNGIFLSKINEEERVEKLKALKTAGLKVLCLSRHSEDKEKNKQIMGVDTATENIFNTLKKENINLKVRLISVLQKTGVEDSLTISSYLDFAVKNEIEEVCFKELYVASTLESKYYQTPENYYAHKNQVSLKEVIDFMTINGFKIIETLPWGSPVFFGSWKGKEIKIAAYTEPNVGWERSNGVCRSWNLMSDGKVYASLEDLESEIHEL